MITLIVLAIILLSFGVIAFIGAPYVPTHRSQIRKAFTDFRPLDKSDLIIDLGSGDGVILRMAASYGARGVGYELNPVLWFISYILGRRYNGRVKTILANYSIVSFPEDTTIVYAFADGRSIKAIKKLLERHVKRTGKSVEFLSYGFELPSYKASRKSGGMFLYRIEPTSFTGV